MTEKEIAEQRAHFRIEHRFGKWNVYDRTRTIAVRIFAAEKEAEEFCDKLARIPGSPEMNAVQLGNAIGGKWVDEL